LWDAPRRSHISVAAALEMSLEQQALHLAALGLLLRFNLVERELPGTSGKANSRAAGVAAAGEPGDSTIGSGHGWRGRKGVAVFGIDIFLRYFLP